MSNEPKPAAPNRSLLLGLSGVGLLGVAGLCLCLLVVGVGGYLFINQRSVAAAEPAVQYVLDVSPRMALPVEGGEGTRLAAAQAVLAEIVRPSNPALTSGFRVFGSEATGEACIDTSLLVPMGRANQSQIADSILSVEAGASSSAALAEAMIAAIKDLARSRGPHTLVVVTGGADSCNAQAAALIEQEAERAGVNLQQFVIGFQVTAEDAEAIKAMVAQAAGATYYDAPDANALRQLLETAQQVLTRPLQSVAAVTPGDGSGEPTGLAPSDDYQSQTACDHPYFPLRTGATWTYNVSGSGSSSTYTWNVGNVSGDLNNATASVQIVIDTVTLNYEWVCSSEGVSYFSFGSANLGDAGFTTTFDITSRSGASILSVDRLEAGEAWESAYTMVITTSGAGITSTATNDVSESHSAGPVERLSTALGTFDVIPMTTTSTYTTTSSAAGQSFTASGSSTSVTYLAKGIGILRSESSGEGFTSTTELVSYSIPQ